MRVLFLQLKILLGIIFLMNAPCIAQGDAFEEYLHAYLTVQVEATGLSHVSFNLTRQQPLSPAQLNNLSTALGFPIQLELDEQAKDATAVSNEEQETGAAYFYFGKYERQFEVKGNQIQTVIPMQKVIEILRDAQVNTLNITILLPSNSKSPTPDSIQAEPNIQRYAIETHNPVLSELKIEYGTSPQKTLVHFVILSGIILFPILFTLGLSAQLLHRHRKNSKTTQISALGYINLIAHLLPVSWWVGVYYAQLMEQFTQALGLQAEWTQTIARIVLYAIPPILCGIICNAIWQTAVSKVKGERRTLPLIFQHAALLVVVSLLPTILLYNGIFSVARGDIRQGIAFFVLHAVFQSFVTKWQWKAMGLHPYILPNGRLRHRIELLAQKAETKLQQIFLVADQFGQTANAFALSGNNLLLTEYLLNNLSAREIEFIVSHELSHLKLNHSGKKAAISFILLPLLIILLPLTGALATLVGLLAPLQFIALTQSAIPMLIVAGVLLSITVELHFSRKFEYSADALAISFTNDPEAAIAALVKLGKLNLEPINWGKFNSKLLTHPSILNRIKALATAHKIPVERVHQITAEAVAAQATKTTDLTYDLAVPSAAGSQIGFKQTEIPQGKRRPILYAPIFSALLGMATAWLVTAPGFYVAEILHENQISSSAIIVLTGLCFALNKGWTIKRRIFHAMPSHVEFIKTNVLESPAITHASAMDQILAFTNELEALGFKYVTDFTITTHPATKTLGFARLFIHPTFLCYAEVNYLANNVSRQVPAGCSIISDLGNFHSFTTTNREPDSFTYALRIPHALWDVAPLTNPATLLERHLEKRSGLLRIADYQLQTNLTAQKYFDQNRQYCLDRKTQFQRRSIFSFMTDIFRFERHKKLEWRGNRKIHTQNFLPQNVSHLKVPLISYLKGK